MYVGLNIRYVYYYLRYIILVSLFISKVVYTFVLRYCN